jgi:hypothetical protein
LYTAKGVDVKVTQVSAVISGSSWEVERIESKMTISDAAIEAEIDAKGLTAPRITLEHLEIFVREERTFVLADALKSLGLEVPEETKVMTICSLVMKNGFVVIGTSACASPENFNAELGAKIARGKAMDQLWALEGYQLRSRLTGLV